MKEPRFEKGQKVYDIESKDSGRVKAIYEKNGVWVYTVKLARPHIVLLYGADTGWTGNSTCSARETVIDTAEIEEFHLIGVPLRYD